MISKHHLLGRGLGDPQLAPARQRAGVSAVTYGVAAMQGDPYTVPRESGRTFHGPRYIGETSLS